ncbi:uncharacterized protein TNCV_4113121 [Trichonephila clavipes]|nr:uncharacterized protein TNCV_4113121 [Trichonephila clavipes]
MSFYVTHVSDSSKDFFPENNVSHFITQLPTPITLKGEWEMGLVDFNYPHTWYNIREGNNLFGFDLGDGKLIARKIPQGCVTFERITIVRVHYFVRGGFVGHRSRASSKHLSPHLPVDELDSSGVKKGLRCSCKMHVWVLGPQRSRLDVDVSEE